MWTAMLRFLPQILTGVSWVLLFGYGYFLGSANESDKWQIRVQQEELSYQNKINSMVALVREQEFKQQEQIQAIMAEQYNKEETLKNEYESIVNDLRSNNVKLSGLLDTSETKNSCASVQKTTNVTGGVVCYRKQELYERIEKSLALARQCDDLALKYNSLLRIYKDAQNDR